MEAKGSPARPLTLQRRRGELPEAQEGSDDVTEEEMAELEKRYQDMVSGRVKGIPEKDAIRMIREGTEG